MRDGMPNARFDGRCRCGEPVKAGDPVRFADRRVANCGACDPALARQVTALPFETLVRITDVRWRKDDGSFVVASAVLEKGQQEPGDTPIRTDTPFDLVGPLGDVRPDDLLEIRARVEQVDQTRRSGGGRNLPSWQVVASVVTLAVGVTDQALIRFLQAFPQVGPKRAVMLLQKLGGREEVLKALETDPSRLTAVAGITEERAKEIAAKYNGTAGYRDALFFLADLGIRDDSQLHREILEQWQHDAPAVIRDDPYVLMNLQGVGFASADGYAKKLGVGPGDERRLAALVVDLLQRAEDEGHTWSTVDDLLTYARAGQRAGTGD